MLDLFSKVLDMSLTGSIVILAVLLVRCLLRNSPKVLSYALWSVVLFRLLCPVSISAPVSLLEVTRPQTVAAGEGTSSLTYLQAPPAPSAQPQPALPETSQPQTGEAPAVQETKKQSISLAQLLTWTWVAGAAVMILHSSVSCWQLRRRLVGATPFRDNVYLADHIPTPFVLGILRPKIFLPSDTPARERCYILAHEQHHIRRWDHLTKVLAYAALCIHWFNPLVWLAFFLAGKDMEMSCDEAVVRRLGMDTRADYAQTLLRLATHRPIIAGTPLAFGEGDTKGRVKNLAKWRRPKTWVVVISAVLCAAVLFLCAVNPGGREEKVRSSGIEGFTVEIPWEYRLETRNGDTWFMKGAKEAGGFRSHAIPEDRRGDALRDVEWLISSPDVEGAEKIKGTIHKDPVDGYLPMVIQYRDSDLVTYHHFYEEWDRVYEIWFVDGVMPEAHQEQILDSIYYRPSGGQDKMGLSLPADVVDVDDGSGEIRFFLTEPIPGQISSQVDTGELLGGIRTYDTPEQPLGILGMDGWLRELGVPQILDGQHDYMLSGGVSNDLEASFADAGGRETQHSYYVQGEKVFELWLDTEKLDAMTRAAILQSVSFGSEAKIERSLPMLYPDAVIGDMVERAEQQTEAVYLQRCRTFLEELKASSDYYVKLIRSYYGDEQDTSVETQNHYFRGEDWLEAGDRFKSMYRDGTYYNNLGSEDDVLQLVSTDKVYESGLWFHKFDWEAQDVLYTSMTPAGSGMCITLQVMAPYFKNAEDSYDHYFVSFIFDEHIVFQRAEITAYYRDLGHGHGAYNIQETILLLGMNDGVAENAIESEYQRYLAQ